VTKLDLFISFIVAYRFWGYGLLFFAMIFEGELFLTAVGMIVRLEAFDFLATFFFVLSGVLVGDMFWYWVGMKLKSRYPNHRIATFVIHRVKKYLPGIEKNPFHVIFLSKFIYGLNHSTLVVLGFLRVPFGHFMRIQFIASFIWSLLFLAIGYLFGSVALAFTHKLKRFILIALLLLIAIAIIERIVRRIIVKIEQKHLDEQ
jgi:membrane protein DedA with SNARE-associated domain